MQDFFTYHMCVAPPRVGPTKGGFVKKWTKDAALAELETLIRRIDALGSLKRFSAEHTRWLSNSLTFLEEVFGRDSSFYQSLKSLRWSLVASYMFVDPSDPQGDADRQHHAAYRSDLETAKGILQAAHDKLERGDIDEVYEAKDTPPEASQIIRLINLAEKSFRKAIHGTPATERELQNAFETLLVGADIEYTREQENLPYATKSYIPDFVMSRIDLVTEIKFSNRAGREKEIIAEINDDILAYRTKWANMLFVVYDMGFIRDAERFSAEFEKNPNVVVRVVKH